MGKIERLGDLLINKGLLSYPQLTEALEFQAKLNEKNYMPIGEVLISFGFITRNILLEVLKEQSLTRNGPPPPPPGFTKNDDPNRKVSFAGAPPPPPPVNPGFTKTGSHKVAMPSSPFTNQAHNNQGATHANSAQEQQKAKHRPIGEILVEKGFIDRFTLSKALQYQSVLPPTHHKPIGEILIELHNITREQLDEALGIQPPVRPNSLGEILKQLGVIDDAMLSMVLTQQHSVGGQTVPVGELLVQHGFITRQQLEQALAEQKRRQ